MSTHLVGHSRDVDDEVRETVSRQPTENSQTEVVPSEPDYGPPQR